MVDRLCRATSEWDLHCHSTYSDGSLTPKDLVERAALMGVKRIALTDHDSLEGIQEFKQAAEANGIEPVAGVECSTQWSGVNIHVLALGFPYDSNAMHTLIQKIAEGREERAKTIASRLESRLQLTNVYEKAQSVAGEGSLGRPHFAKVLVEAGVVNSAQQAFKKYLGAGKIGDVKTCWPSMDSVVSEITAYGGIAVLAHPGTYKMTRTKLRRLIQCFKTAGGQAVELSTPAHDPEFNRWLVGYLEEMQLAASVGSDFHAPSPWAELGAVTPLSQFNCKPVWQLFN